MGRILLTALASLLAAGIAFTGTASARQDSPVTDPSIVPEYLRAVPMYRTHPGLTIDVPLSGATSPPDTTPPQFQWRDDNPAATIWRIEIIFGEHAKAIHLWSNGDKMQIGPLDESLK